MIKKIIVYLIIHLLLTDCKAPQSGALAIVVKERNSSDLLESLDSWGVSFQKNERDLFIESGGFKDIGFVPFKQINIYLESQNRKNFVSRRCTFIWKKNINGKPEILKDIEKHFEIIDFDIIEVYQKKEVFKEPALYSVKFGYHFILKDGYLSELSCHEPVANYSEKCNDSIFLNPDSSIKDIIPNKRKCKQGCGQFQPLRQPGEYYITTNKVRVRENPDTKSKILAELSKDMRVEVTKDAEVYEKIFPHFATWGKVKLDDGSEGYVYGAFLRAPGEPDVVAIREKAEEWKKKNGWKGK